jgi:dynein heavy chain 2
MVFREVLENFARVDRVLSVPGGSVLLAGRCGVGRRTAVQLIAHMHQMVLFTPKMTRNYGLKQFKTDLKTVNVPNLNIRVQYVIIHAKKLTTE